MYLQSLSFAVRLLVLTSLVIPEARATAETVVLNTDKFSNLEIDVPGVREKFVREQDHLTHARLAKSANYRPIEKWLKELYDKPQVRKEVELDKKTSLKLVDRGLGKPTDLVYSTPGFSEVLFSSYHFKRNNTVTFVDFQISPDHRRVAMAFAFSGSIDNSQIAILNLDRRQLEGPMIPTTQNEFAWFSSRELILHQEQSDSTDQIVKWDIDTQKAVIMLGASLLDHSDDAVLIDGGREKKILQNLHEGTGWKRLAVPADAKSIIGVDGKYAYLLCGGKNQLGEVRAFALAGGDADKAGRLLVAEADQPVRKSYFAGHHVILMLRNGAARKLRVYDVSAAADAAASLPLMGEIAVPDCCSVSGVRWETVSSRLRVTLVSAVQNKTVFIYDLSSSTWDKDPAAAMLVANGVKYKTQILDAVSKDGAHVPVRMTMREDNKADGTHPAFFQSYGGFKLAAYLDPSYQPAMAEYLRRGGILAGAGLRGGDEFGPDWHKQAMNEKKINTFNDLAAAVKLVIDQGWTTAPKVISAGGSNGGLTVAATGLLFPELFGLVVPYAGVLDMLGRDHLDPRNEGWDWEYGKVADFQESMKAISPLELVSHQGSVRYLIFTGLNDSRVNTAHSIKFAAALKAQGQNPALVDLVALKNSGHWLKKVEFQNLIAWHSEAVLWTTIFDQVGWTW